MKVSHQLRRAGLGLAVVALLAACAPAPPSPAQNARQQPAQPAASGATTAQAPAAQAGAAGALQATAHTGVAEEAPIAAIPEVRIALGADLVNTNPFNAFAVTDKSIIKHFLSSLTRINEHGEVLPLLAESWELIGPTTWQFRLRRGVR